MIDTNFNDPEDLLKTIDFGSQMTHNNAEMLEEFLWAYECNSVRRVRLMFELLSDMKSTAFSWEDLYILCAGIEWKLDDIQETLWAWANENTVLTNWAEVIQNHMSSIKLDNSTLFCQWLSSLENAARTFFLLSHSCCADVLKEYGYVDTLENRVYALWRCINEAHLS